MGGERERGREKEGVPTLLDGEQKDHQFIRRFPDFARSSFWLKHSIKMRVYEKKRLEL